MQLLYAADCDFYEVVWSGRCCVSVDGRYMYYEYNKKVIRPVEHKCLASVVAAAYYLLHFQRMDSFSH